MFGERLKELREDQGMTQSDLANMLNISRASISGYETEANDPSIDILIKLADIFNVSLDYLLGRTKEKYNLNLMSKANKSILLELYKVIENYKIYKK
ncbi:MAG: helix-turn-helix transcriptional regulator [Clostridiales bacterium]|nr:helix-turn-helix transcriptional regulator [Clostridiales bacterium]